MRAFASLLLLCSADAPGAPAALEDLVVDRDDVVVERSCRVRVLAPWIHDDEGDGILQVRGDDVVLDFDGASLAGAAPETSLAELAGVGVRITGKGVHLRNGRFRGFKAAIHASGADGLVIEDCSFEGNFAQHLGSTSEAEDGADWLWPHENDGNEWLASYGAAVYVEDARDVTLRGNRVRRGQNGFVLDRVEGPKVYDNDASFLSGWGLALWRTSDGTITRNAFDF
jgi:parallel beta-helix repeat protein